MPGNGATLSRTKNANLNGVLTPNTTKYHTRGIYPIQDDRIKIKQFYDYFPASAIWITLIASFLTIFPSRNSNARYPIWSYNTKLNVASVSEIMTNNAVFSSHRVSSSSSSYSIRSRSSLISNGANLAPQLIKIDFAVFPETKCQGLFSIPLILLHEKSHCRFQFLQWLLGHLYSIHFI